MALGLFREKAEVETTVHDDRTSDLERDLNRQVLDTINSAIEKVKRLQLDYCNCGGNFHTSDHCSECGREQFQ